MCCSFVVVKSTFNVEQNTSPTFNRVGVDVLHINAQIDNEVVNYSVTALTSRWGWFTTIYPKDSTEKVRAFGLFTVKQQNDVNNSLYIDEIGNEGDIYTYKYKDGVISTVSSFGDKFKFKI